MGDKKKSIALMVLGDLKKKGSPEAVKDDKSALRSAASDAMQAVKDDDVDAFMSAMTSFNKLCGDESYSDGEDDSAEE